MMGDRVPPAETRGGEKPDDWKITTQIPDFTLLLTQHTWTPQCDGAHGPGACPGREEKE